MENINTYDYWQKRHGDNLRNASRSKSTAAIAYFDFVVERIIDDPAVRVLDVGCGKGVFVQYLAQKKKEIEIWGTDFSDNIIDFNKEYFKNNPKVDFFKSDFLNDFNEEFAAHGHKDHYDYVVCMEVLEHVTDYKKMITVLNNLCTSTGKVMITVPNKEAIRSEDHVHYFSSDQLMKDFKAFGTNIEYERIRKLGGKSVRNLAFCYIPKK